MSPRGAEGRDHALALDATRAIGLLLEEQAVPEALRADFAGVAHALESLFHHEFLAVRRRLRNAWEQLDAAHAGSDTVATARSFDQREAAKDLLATLRRLMRRANFVDVAIDELTEAMQRSSLLGVAIQLDLRDYEELASWRRREFTRKKLMPTFLGMRKRPVEVTFYDRFCLFARFKGHDHFRGERGRKQRLGAVPGGIALRLFKDVPKHDVEALFPGVRVRMRLFDRALIGVPAAVGFLHFVILKFTASIGVIALGLLFFCGLRKEAPDWKQASAALVSIGVLLAFLFRQWLRFVGRKSLLHRLLSEHLQTCTLDTGVGVLLHLLDDAEQEETLEAILAWAFLVRAGRPLPLEEVDREVEAWITRHTGLDIDFEQDDALAKLLRLGLVKREGTGPLVALAPAAALALLRERWAGLLDTTTNGATNGE